MEHQLNIINNKREFRYEAQLPGGELVFVSYRWQKANMLLMQASAPAGAKDTLNVVIKHVLEHARQHHLRIVVYAPAVAEYMKENGEWEGLLFQQ